MSASKSKRRPSAASSASSSGSLLPGPSGAGSLASRPNAPRRRSISTLLPLASASGPSPLSADLHSAKSAKAQRTSKTSQKLVVLPSEPQTKPLPRRRDSLTRYHDDDADTGLSPALYPPQEDEEDYLRREHSHEDTDSELGYETDAGVRVRESKSASERMTKAQRNRAATAAYSAYGTGSSPNTGLSGSMMKLGGKTQHIRRLTAYCFCDSLNMPLLTGFLRREHNVVPRVFDEAVHATYHLPLLPGYTPTMNIRSSVALDEHKDANEADDGYMTTDTVGTHNEYTIKDTVGAQDGYLTADTLDSPTTRRAGAAEPEALGNTRADASTSKRSDSRSSGPPTAEVIFFTYGVVVFFGLSPAHETLLLSDLSAAGIITRQWPEAEWEIEECHFTYDASITHPRIYNDFFTLKLPSHLLISLTISHALAQSTLLARYETIAQRVLSSPMTLAIPRQLAKNGALQMKRHEALKLTGLLFKLRRDVNLVSNVLDIPELFWSEAEANLTGLYNAVREYMEIPERVEGLNERLQGTGAFLDAIHDHLNGLAMERITWVVIWLIVVAILVELGEVIARLVVHDSLERTTRTPFTHTRQDVLDTLERMIR